VSAPAPKRRAGATRDPRGLARPGGLIFLAVALVVALPVVYCRHPAGPDDLPPGEAAPPAPAWPDVPDALVARSLLARDAAAGRRTLLEAAALFRELNRRPPVVMPPAYADPNGPPLTIPLDTEEARLCRQVILHAYYALRSVAPGRADAAVARLEAEFFAERRAHGAIRLPDPASLEPVEELLQQARAWIAQLERRAAGAGQRPTTR
jgi:hypothetical protein